MPAVIDDAFRMVGHISKLKQVTLVAPVFEENQEKIFKSLKSDKGRLLQVLVNLLSNALKFSNSGSSI